MELFKAIRERRDIEKKYLPLILAELVKLNERDTQQGHEVLGVFRDLHRDLAALGADTKNFVEVIRHFFAVERTIRDAEEKRREKERQDAQPGKHDDMF